MNQSNLKVLAWSLIVALGGFLFGFDTAVISGVEKTIQTLFDLSSVEHGFVISSALIGTVLGAVFAGKPVDRYGRRPVLFFIAASYLVSAIGCALAFNVSSLVFFRLLGGVGVGASSVVAPMYISEIAPARIRGRMTALFQFNVIFGILMAYVSNYLLFDTGDHAWRWMLGVSGIPSAVYLLLLLVVPESPRYLVMRGRTEEAKRIFVRIGTEDADRTVAQVQGQVSDEGGRAVLFTKANRKPILIAFLVAMFNQLSAINIILYYAPRIFELSGLSSADSLLQSIAIGVTNGLFTLLGLMLIDRVGRRTLLIVGSVGMTVCLGLMGGIFLQQSFGGWLLLTILLVYIMFFAVSTGAVIWVLIAEVFPNAVRGKGQSLGSFTHWFFAAVITFCFPVVAGLTDGPAFTFIFCAVAMVAQALVAWLYFPETKGRTLEELSDGLERG